MLTDLQYWMLKTVFPGDPSRGRVSAYAGRSKLEALLGRDFLLLVPGKTVIDFGCGEGKEAVEMARRGARRVLGIDIREDVLEAARERALASGVQDLCRFATSASETADIVISIDSFEHFADPAQALQDMSLCLKPDGKLFISFGPTWYHPLGGHLFSPFPWAHLILSEEALIRWRSTFIRDGARKFNEVSGGLNQMTIKRFETLVRRSNFRVVSLEPIPIAKLRPLHSRITREFTSSVVRCELAGRA